MLNTTRHQKQSLSEFEKMFKVKLFERTQKNNTFADTIKNNLELLPPPS